MELTSVYEDIKALNAEVVAISVDDLSGASGIVERVGIPFPVLYDPSREVPGSYKVFNLLGDGVATPSTFVVDQNGVIVWKYVANSISDRPPSSIILSQLANIAG